MDQNIPANFNTFVKWPVIFMIPCSSLKIFSTSRFVSVAIWRIYNPVQCLNKIQKCCHHFFQMSATSSLIRVGFFVVNLQNSKETNNINNSRELFMGNSHEKLSFRNWRHTVPFSSHWKKELTVCVLAALYKALVTKETDKNLFKYKGPDS